MAMSGKGTRRRHCVMDDEPKVEVITPPDTLKKKVKTGGPGAVDLDTLNRAEAVIADRLAEEKLRAGEGATVAA